MVDVHSHETGGAHGLVGFKGWTVVDVAAAIVATTVVVGVIFVTIVFVTVIIIFTTVVVTTINPIISAIIITITDIVRVTLFSALALYVELELLH